MMASTTEIVKNGLWTNNPGLVQLLGLCPLLAVSSTVINALGMGLATTLVLVVSNIAVSMIRNSVRQDIRIPVFVMIIAAAVTTIELVMNAAFHELYTILGIFIPLIVTNCVIIGRAEAFASRNSVPLAALDGFMMGIGFTLVLIALGGVREVLAFGTLFDRAELMFGPVAADWQLTIIPEFRGFLLAALPPGAFIALGCLIAMKNSVDTRLAKIAKAKASLAETGNDALAA
ncbi:MAG: electron transport complex subunit E [Gammaproteobacteria bacterium]|nr:electron transport complex subunit E [Gammaproteobacteria bacterium]